MPVLKTDTLTLKIKEEEKKKNVGILKIYTKNEGCQLPYNPTSCD